MAQVIKTNILSLTTQNNLNRSQSALSNAIQRLSSGLRINSAKDDAAGQAISNRFTANTRGLTQAVRNANDGISIVQTAEGGLNEINDNLQRVRELIVQAKNGSNSITDLKSIKEEIKQRTAEINRISEQTQFNGVHVLNDDNEMTIQIGTNDNEVIKFKLDKINSDTLDIANNKLLTTSTVRKGETKIGAIIDPSTLGISGITDYKTGYLVGEYILDGKVVKDKYIAVSGNRWYLVSAGAFEADATDKTKLVIKASAMGPANNFTPSAGRLVEAFSVNDGALAALDFAISKVDNARSALGAVQNRLDSAVNNLNNTVTHLTAANSRILDADYAMEVSHMSKGQILQQAGTSVLAQANQLPQNVLSLLR
ncbi:FliC/FljB family flagellin [Proteus sp. fly-1008]|uniref:FliC/FljB family flagellin n=1 Tax=Proteus sp. fly-1008 TaxID=3136672 RepID=UPI0032D9C8DF